jgi:hypothetical protein
VEQLVNSVDWAEEPTRIESVAIQQWVDDTLPPGIAVAIKEALKKPRKRYDTYRQRIIRWEEIRATFCMEYFADYMVSLTTLIFAAETLNNFPGAMNNYHYYNGGSIDFYLSFFLNDLTGLDTISRDSDA